ncbi:MAG: hypothetical protein KGL39_09220 [Patescibacteria group bacterium]|nr:hypothetical protein [Patescibacteria group bacterium]
MSFLPILAGGLGLLGSIFGSSQQNQSSQQLSQLLNQLMGMQTGVLNQTQQQLGMLNSEAGQYTSLLPGLAGTMGNELAGPGSLAPGAAEQYMLAGMSPGALSSMTGVNSLAPEQQALQYLGNPGGTALSQLSPEVIAKLTGSMQLGNQFGVGKQSLAGVSPQLENFFRHQMNLSSPALKGAQGMYRTEMQQGLSPQVATNAMNQLQQQFQQSLSNIKAGAAPGQNLNAADQAAQNQLLSQSTNESANLAQLSQQFKNTGAQGLEGLQQLAGAGAQGLQGVAGQLDQQQLARVAQNAGLLGQATQTASMSDAQRMQMLEQAAQSSLGYNQTQLGNMQGAAGFGQNVLGGLQNFVGQGTQMQEFGAGALASLFNSLASQTSGIAGAAIGAQSQASQNNPFSFLGSLFGGGSMGSLFGGSTGSGGLDLSMLDSSFLPTSAALPGLFG